MKTIVLISCSDSKLSRPATAEKLYSPSALFSKSLEYAKSLKPDRIYILSAKHHLVNLDRYITPYNKTLADMSEIQKLKWKNNTLREMRLAKLDLEKDKFIFLTGNEYMEPLLDSISNYENPLEGLRFGERLEELNNLIS